MDEAKSRIKTINIGVPQGSILGPLLFLIYIKDMSQCSDLVHFIHFADDTAVLPEGDNLDESCALLNS